MYPLICLDYDNTLVDDSNDLFPQTMEVLNYIRNSLPGVGICLVSFNIDAPRFCKSNGIDRFISLYQADFDPHMDSQKVEMMKYIANQLGIKTSAMILFDDQLQNILDCDNAGIIAVQIPDGGVTIKHIKNGIKRWGGLIEDTLDI